ncbi:MAG TPA: hypothetical protein VM186_03645 [Planctomycetota bacterium]|nr:hypothetical protein [Planctomycetota bacterium]
MNPPNGSPGTLAAPTPAPPAVHARGGALLALFAMSLIYFFSYFHRVAVPGQIFDNVQSSMHLSAAAVTVGGDGYLYPWTNDDLLKRVKSIPELVKVAQVCKEALPVASRKPTKKVIAIREAMGKLWGGNDYDAPYDWRWVIQETY